jgi:hypothetical protein
MVTLFSTRNDGAPASGTNAASQWVWGRKAKEQRGVSARYTLLGFAIHHASSIFWATGYELWKRDSDPPERHLAKAASISALAYLVDYHVVPSRLSPGFDRRISALGMVATYSAFAAGLCLPLAHRMLRRGSRTGRAPSSPNPAPE